jgi:hypothetical protein
MTAELPTSVAFLRRELVRAAARRRSRSRSLVLTIGALVASAALLVVSGPGPALADVQVEVQGGRLLVRLVDLEHRPEHIEGVLRGLGLDASVVDAPVGPSQVGRFVGTLDDSDLATDLRRLGAAKATFQGFSVPVGWTGRLDLRVGRPAGPGESYAVFSDALAPGEPLACRPLLGRPADEVLGAVAHLDLEVVVQVGSGFRRPEAVLAGPARHERVRAIDAASARRVVVRLGSGPGGAGPPSPGCPT